MKKILILIAILIAVFSCKNKEKKHITKLPNNIINYTGVASTSDDKSLFVFSDQGSWFAYSIPDTNSKIIGFSGPYLMTQENGTWISECLSELKLSDKNNQEIYDWETNKTKIYSYNSHISKINSNEQLIIKQELFFESSGQALIKISIKNISEEYLEFYPSINGKLINNSISFSDLENSIKVSSNKSTNVGSVKILGDSYKIENISDSCYLIRLENCNLKPNDTKRFYISQSFNDSGIVHRDFSKYDSNINKTYNLSLKQRKLEKQNELYKLYSKMPYKWQKSGYKSLIAKCVLTLQNNWRTASKGLYHAGCFPSYHYEWFHGFWAWDSWKHAVALVHYNSDLAKDQIRAMYDFQNKNGFIADCVYRDNTIEANNYRNTKPPLSGWAIWEVFEETKDTSFLKEMYPKLKLYHEWWYKERDIDDDGLCEYGSTDGTLIAAKWESGMDNAIRFDNSEILRKTEEAYSLNQESVDLNAYLYAEKKYMINIAGVLQLTNDQNYLKQELNKLKEKIQNQFWDKESGWFYDTDLKGENHIKTMGPEGWIPLWANIATTEQALQVKNQMMDRTKFLTKVPFPTVSASHPKFNPNGGYWRGPVWLDKLILPL